MSGKIYYDKMLGEPYNEEQVKAHPESYIEIIQPSREYIWNEEKQEWVLPPVLDAVVQSLIKAGMLKMADVKLKVSE